MKKILALCLMIALAFGAGGATCLQNIQGKVCNPTADSMNVANAVVAVLLPVLNSLVPGSAAFNAYITAQNIQAGGCVTITELNNLIIFIQGINTQNQLAAKKGVLKMAPALIPVQPLENWRDGKK